MTDFQQTISVAHYAVYDEWLTGQGGHLYSKVDMMLIQENNYKVVLEPRASPSFVVSYFCNHCNVRFDSIPAKMWNQRSMTPR